jgi:transaldolase
MSAAQELWNPSFSAFTVNNTLLNAEVQKGTYDELMCTAHRRLSGLERRARITEIAFILNARHGLRLVERFGARVSVELHTSVAHDIAGTLHYAQRLHALRPDRFYIKVPLTPAGLIATRRLEEQGIPVNLTLGFSARQNYIATVFAKPTFVNVFLGRLNAFIAAAKLGSGDLVGERTTVASWKAVARARTDSGASTRQIAAGLRNPAQVAALAGIEVQTMPVKVARAAAQELDGRWESCLDTDYTVELAVDTRPATVRIEKLWDLSRQTREFARSIAGDAPSSPRRLMERAHEAGVPDLFPSFSSGERQTIRNEGKIPVHATWADRIEQEEVAIDSLLNAAGLGAFEADQQALDRRIESLTGE